MQQIFLNNDPTDGCFIIEGEDAHHLGRVVRIRVGEQIRVSTSSEENYICDITEVEPNCIKAKIVESVSSTELPCKIYLFQAIPKGDRMETVIEKCVELGVFEIIPVEMANCVVKLDDKKKKTRVQRWQTIADTAAKQSKRSIQPKVHEVVSFSEALRMAGDCDIRLVPYESKNGMADTKEALASLGREKSVSIIIGPEGGFAPKEIEKCQENMSVISLGSRILRTDTAAITSLSIVMAAIEMIEV